MDSAKIRELKAETGYWVYCPICNSKTRTQIRDETRFVKDIFCLSECYKSREKIKRIPFIVKSA